MNAIDPQALPYAAVHWPAPPFFRLADSPKSTRSNECVLELLDGHVTREDLLEFGPGLDSISVRSTDPPGLKRLDLAAIRSIKLTRAVAYVPDTAALDAIGATDPAVDNRKAFVVSLTDGGKMTGRTLGFVKDASGTYALGFVLLAAFATGCLLVLFSVLRQRVPPGRAPQGVR